MRQLLAADLDEGFVALVRGYGSLVRTVAARACAASPAEAEDLAADALLGAYRALRTYAPERIAGLRLRPWLVTIVLNASRNRRRAAARRPATSPLAAGAEPYSTIGLTDDWDDRRDGSDRLQELLRDLPSAQRTAVVLRHVACLSIPEIAEVLRCPEGTAKSHVSRGLQRLRRLHAGREETP